MNSFVLLSTFRNFAVAMEEVKFDFKKVPLSWQLCFLDDCPKKDECLRQLAVRHLTGSREFGPAVYPTMKRGDNGCRLFTAGEPKRMAYGFTTLFAEVKAKHEQGLRLAMKQYLGGHSHYYRYHHGERLLSPEQQEWIVNLFRRYGYTEGLAFDAYVSVYDFDH